MAYVMSIRAQTGGGSGSTIDADIETFVQTEAFSAGLELVVAPPIGTTILQGLLTVNMNEKLLIRGEDYDYTFDGTDTITILFGDDVASGDIIFQVSYAYTTP